MTNPDNVGGLPEVMCSRCADSGELHDEHGVYVGRCGCDGETSIIVCQGPPRCELQGDEAVAAQNAGCVWCLRIYIDEVGNERTESPVNA